MKKDRRATFDDLLALPENVTGEVIDGQLIVSPRPAGPHTFAASNLGYDLIGPFQRGIGGPGGWWFIRRPELRLGTDALVPDLTGWRQERMAVYPAKHFVSLPPDWVCEILSPSTAVVDRKLKLKVYAREGVRNVWLMDPILKTLEVLRLDGQRWLLVETFSGHEQVRAEPFDAIPLNLSGLWLPEVHDSAR